MDLKKIIAANLKTLRDHLEMNQTAFAERCKMHQRTYGRIENAETWPHLEMIGQIAKECNLEAWQLLTPSFNPKNPPVLQEVAEKQKIIYESIRAAAKEIAKLEQ